MVRRSACGAAALVVLAGAGLADGARAATVPEPELVDLGGTRVEVSTDPSDPTPLTAGLWADTLTGSAQAVVGAHWFSVARTMRDSSVLVGVAATSPDTSGALDGLEVTVFEPGGDTCGSDQATGQSQIPQAVLGAAVLVPGDEPGNSEDPCVRSEVLQVRVTRGTSAAEGDLPITLRVVEEAPVAVPADELVPTAGTPTVTAPTPTEPVEVAGATSYADAPGLRSGRTVSDAVLQGSEHLYRVRLDRGQGLAVRVDVPAQDESASAALGGFSPVVGLALLDPLRSRVDSGHPDTEDSVSYGAEPARLFDGTRPVALGNRFDDGEVSVPGDYLVSVRVAPPNPYDADAPLEPVPVPFELTVEVVGDPVAPQEFERGVLAPTGDPGPEGYDPAAPYLVADGVFAADVSGTPRGPEAGADGSRRVAGLVVGGLSLVSLAAGAALLVRRRRAGEVSRAAAR